MHADVNAMAFTEDPIEKQRKNKSQRLFADRNKKINKEIQEDYVSKDLNNFMLEPWTMPAYIS